MSEEVYSNQEAEKAVLGAAMNDPSVIDRIMAWIRAPEAFWYKRNEKVWKSILELYKRGITVDAISMSNRYKEKYKEDLDPVYITEIREVAYENHNPEHHARIVWERHIQREAIKISKKLESASKMDVKNIEELLGTHQKYLEELSNLHPSKEKSIDMLAKQAASEIIKGNHIIDWGEKHLNDFAGGLTRGEFTALGGRPGNGKTTLMMNMVDTLTIENPQLKISVFNREMTNNAAISKLMILNSKILSTADFRKKELSNAIKEEVEKQAEVVSKKYSNLRMYDSVIELDETMREIKRYEPDIVFDDYIQLIKINGKRSRDRRFEIEDIVNEYKWMLKRVNASGVLVSQLSRDIEKRIDNSPTMADYSEGGTIEQGAETCMFVYYPYYFDPAEWSPYQNEIIVKKARYGKIGTYTVGFSGPKCKFFINPTEAKEMSE
jgi:replicative DNA helicase